MEKIQPKDKKQSTIDIPDSFICPISLQIMKDPVIAKDGITYQRQKIQQWFKSNQKSPYTNIQLPDKTLIPNIAIKKCIDNFKNNKQCRKYLGKVQDQQIDDISNQYLSSIDLKVKAKEGRQFLQFIINKFENGFKDHANPQFILKFYTLLAFLSLLFTFIPTFVILTFFTVYILYKNQVNDLIENDLIIRILKVIIEALIDKLLKKLPKYQQKIKPQPTAYEKQMMKSMSRDRIIKYD